MVKAADLGYVSTNLQDIPSEEEKKDKEREQAIRNLTSVTTPDRLSLAQLPPSLFKD